jgi:hypothetical protein
MTEALPIAIPSMVRPLRSLLPIKAEKAIFRFSSISMVSYIQWGSGEVGIMNYEL